MEDSSESELLIINNFEKQLEEYNIPQIKETEIIKIKPHVGEGGFGKVYKGLYGEHTVAIKKIKLISKSKSVFNDILNEMIVLKLAESPKIPRFYGIMKKKDYYHLIFEFIEGSTLKDIYCSLEYKDKLLIIKELCLILADFHSRKLIHRDIKPANVMIEDVQSCKVRLIDFGVTKVAQHLNTFTKSQLGTVAYMPPDVYEIDLDKFTDTHESNSTEVKPVPLSNKVDIWALGVLIGEIFSLVKPWTNVNKKLNSLYIIRKLTMKSSFPIPDNLDPEIKCIVEKATDLDPSLRPDALDICSAINEILKTKFSET